MTARILLIPGKTRGHNLLLRAIALALRRPRLQCFDLGFSARYLFARLDSAKALLKIIRQRAGDDEFTLGNRVRKLQLARMQHQARRRSTMAAVKVVTQDGQTILREVYANLMGS